MKLTYAILITLLSFISMEAVAQDAVSETPKPQWLHKQPKPSNSTFVFETDHAIGKTIDEARTKSLNGLITASGFENGVIVVSNYQSKLEDSHRFSNGKLEKYEEDSFRADNNIKGGEVQLHVKNIAEYWTRDENGNYTLTTLYAKAIGSKPNFDDVELTTKYGIEDMWRSAIVPGWGQLYKGSTLKGGLIMGGTVACIGAIIYTDCTRASFNSKIQKTHDAKLKLHYADQRTAYTTGRNICIGALCALYVYNIVDAIVAPGARRILTSPAGSNKFSYFWSPTVTDDMGVGVMASITF